MRRSVSAVAAILALSACGQSPEGGQTAQPASPAASDAPIASAGGVPESWGQCATCHKVKPGEHGIGPSLAGVFGRKAASDPGFRYSEAMKSSGLTWDEATLDRYLENPRALVPGTKMSYFGQKDAAKRAEIVAYLKTLK